MENQQLQELLDKAAIEQIRHQYAQALDYKDWDWLLGLFSDEVQVDFSDFGEPVYTVAKEALIDYFRHNLSRPGLKTQHIFSSFRIKVNGDQAESISNFVGHHFISGFEGGDEFILRAEYTDRLVKTANGWRMHSIAAKLFYMTGNPNVLAS